MKISPRSRLRLARMLWNWRPHPTQRQWLECEARTRVAACGRRWGKTEAAAIDAATLAITRPGCVQMIVSPSYDQSRIAFHAVERLLLASPITRPLVRVTRTPYPRLTVLDSVVSARTADEDGRNLRGHAADRVVVDEAAYVRDSVIAEVISPMLADSDGELVMISTPFGKNHFYRAFAAGRSGGDICASFSFPSLANPHISRDYIERQRAELSPRQFAVEYEARFVDDSSSVFAWDDIESASRIPDPAPEAEPDIIAVGIDWARYSDYTALVAVQACSGSARVIDIDRFNRLGWAAQVERAVDFITRSRASLVLTDQTSIGDPLLEQLRHRVADTGIDTAVEGLIFTGSSKREIIERLVARFSRGELAIPRDERLMRELHYFDYELTPSGSVRMNARSGHSDDLVIALALACRLLDDFSSPAGPAALGERISTAVW